eukprot:CAMPEP_0170193642 /NCGR_PEP_ID=MMETSP0040_2-20121228/57349_1 /TAXON_ID=641309 /ORGANISM="Lotharella oceanica, Strain CCMP622" /LENGTH=51 /DNA_ID=CAMNT_0010442333 /DNA_START=382 /DNA_END=534 /DNA_ORIENTATION=-
MSAPTSDDADADTMLMPMVSNEGMIDGAGNEAGTRPNGQPTDGISTPIRLD